MTFATVVTLTALAIDLEHSLAQAVVLEVAYTAYEAAWPGYLDRAGLLRANRDSCGEIQWGKVLSTIYLLSVSNRNTLPLYRSHGCLQCGHRWSARVQGSQNTPNTSGEATPWCPQCDAKSVWSSPAESLPSPPSDDHLDEEDFGRNWAADRALTRGQS